VADGRLSKTLASIGFEVQSLRSHGYTPTAEPNYMLTLIERGADLLVGSGSLTAEAADAVQKEGTTARAGGGILRSHFLCERDRP